MNERTFVKQLSKLYHTILGQVLNMSLTWAYLAWPEVNSLLAFAFLFRIWGES